MADNTKQSADDNIATDDIVGVKHQRVKVQHGADGSATDVSSASPLPVGDAGGSLTVDSPLSTPVGVRLSDGASALATTSSELHIRDATARTKLGEILTALGGVLTAEVNDAGTKAAVEALGALLTSIDADTSGMLTALQKLDDAIAGSEMQVDVVGPLPAGANAIGKLAANSGVDIGDVTLTAGSALVGDVGLGVRTSGGLTPFKSLDIDETEEQVKGSEGQLYWYHFDNGATTKRYLKFYDDTAANVVVGTTVPVLTLPLPKESSGHVPIPQGFKFSKAITVACTTGRADNDTGAPGENEVAINLGYA